MIVELEGLQVFPVDDGADGLVLASWIERYSSSEVRPVPRSMTVSREQANLLADELAKAAGGDANENLKQRNALEDLLHRYLDLANSGDCGSWNPEEESVVINALTALRQTGSSE